VTESLATNVIFVCPECGTLYYADQGAIIRPTVGRRFQCSECETEVYPWFGAYDYTGWRPYKVRGKKA
jgi:predicted RNA-binding Zn-ribbon protein involved in translation (DUF1610 family)